MKCKKIRKIKIAFPIMIMTLLVTLLFLINGFSLTGEKIKDQLFIGSSMLVIFAVGMVIISRDDKNSKR